MALWVHALPHRPASLLSLPRDILRAYTATRTRARRQRGTSHPIQRTCPTLARSPMQTDTDNPLKGCPSSWRGRPRKTSKLFAMSALVSPNGIAWSASPLNSGDRPLQRRKLTPTTHSRACAGARGIDFSPNQTSY